jgi:hypothetical protein
MRVSPQKPVLNYCHEEEGQTDARRRIPDSFGFDWRAELRDAYVPITVSHARSHFSLSSFVGPVSETCDSDIRIRERMLFPSPLARGTKGEGQTATADIENRPKPKRRKMTHFERKKGWGVRHFERAKSVSPLVFIRSWAPKILLKTCCTDEFLCYIASPFPQDWDSGSQNHL